MSPVECTQVFCRRERLPSFPKTVKGKKLNRKQTWPVPSLDSLIDFSSATLSHKRQWGREFRGSKVGQWTAQYKHNLHVAEQDTGPVKSGHHSGLWTTTGCCQSPKAAAGKSVVVTEWQFKFLNGKGGGIELMNLWNIMRKNQVGRTLSEKEYRVGTSLKKSL